MTAGREPCGHAGGSARPPAGPPRSARYGETVADIRYRCAACGNVTRFDVTVTRTTRAFHHYSVGGDLAVENVDVLAETVDAVSCRWCGHGREVEVVAGAAAAPPAG